MDRDTHLYVPLQFSLCYVTFLGTDAAGVAELVDAPDLGSGDVSRGGSSPFARTIFDEMTLSLGAKLKVISSISKLLCRFPSGSDPRRPSFLRSGSGSISNNTRTGLSFSCRSPRPAPKASHGNIKLS